MIFKSHTPGKKFFTYEKYPEIQNLKKADSGKEINIENRLVWKIDNGNTHMTTGLLPGKYTEFSKNELGSLYFGESRPYYICSEQMKCFLYVGGFWLPSDTNSKPKLFSSTKGSESYEVADIDAEAQKMRDPSRLKYESYSPLIDLLIDLNDPSFYFVKSIDSDADTTFSDLVQPFRSTEN